MTGLYQALVKFADLNDVVEKPHHGLAKFQWQLDLNADGSLASTQLTPLRTTRASKGKEYVDAWQQHLVPRTTRTSGISPMLGADDVAYVLGWADAPDRGDESDSAWERAQERREASASARHAAWRHLIAEWAQYAGDTDPVPGAVVTFLDEHVGEVQRPESWTSKDGVYVRVAGHPAAQSPTAVAFWSSWVDAKKGADEEGLCVICGRVRPLVDTLPSQVKGPLLPNGQSSGVSPISINETAYGYGLRKGLDHVPICVECSLAIVGSLNYLLSNDFHRSRTAESAMVWWIEEPKQHNPAFIVDDARPEDVAALLQSLQAQPVAESLDVSEFHSVILQGNAARMIVRDWTHMPVRELQENIANWFGDTEIVPLWPEGRRYHPLWLLAQCTGRYDESKRQYRDVKDSAGGHPHGIAETLREVALNRRVLPVTVAAHLLQRIAADGRIDDPRAALLRLYLVRTNKQRGQFMPGLDETNTRPSYLLGRLMSIYEDLQYSAASQDGGGTPNATFADKYLAGAITSPRLVLTAGTKQSTAWLTKLRKNRRDYFYKQLIDQIIAQLDAANPGPTRASLDEQAEFVLGYHHQRAASNDARVAAAASKKLAQADNETITETESGE